MGTCCSCGYFRAHGFTKDEAVRALQAKLIVRLGDDYSKTREGKFGIYYDGDFEPVYVRKITTRHKNEVYEAYVRLGG